MATGNGLRLVLRPRHKAALYDADQLGAEYVSPSRLPKPSLDWRNVPTMPPSIALGVVLELVPSSVAVPDFSGFCAGHIPYPLALSALHAVSAHTWHL